MQETVKERLIAFIKSKPMTQKYFCEKIGVSNNFINSIRSGVSYEKLFRIKEEFPEMNTDWLLYGEGEMLNETEATAIVPKNAIPFFDVDFEGGFDEMVNNQTAAPESYISVPNAGRATCACRLIGHSMQPEINNGDIILLERIEDFSWLPLGEIYAIVTTNDMRTVKRLYQSEKENCYRLTPANSEYQSQDIPKKYLYQVYRVIGAIKQF